MYIIGASALADMIFDIIASRNKKVLGHFDDYSSEKRKNGTPIIGKINDLFKDIDRYKNNKFIVAIGDNENRSKISHGILNKGLILDNVIHNNAIIESSAKIGSGNIIFANSYIGSNVVLGNGNIIFPGVSITHHNEIGDFCFFAPNISVGGYTKIQDFVKIGMNSVIAPYIDVNSNFKCDPFSLVKK